MIGPLATFWHSCPAGLREAYASFAVQSFIALAYSLNRYIGHAASRPGIRKFIPWAVLNLTGTFLTHLFFLRILSPDYRRSISVTGFPSAAGFVCEVLGSLLVFEVLFYYVHRLMHTRLFYRPVHAMHHRMTDKVCLGAFYVHPVEFLMVGFGAFMGAVALTRTHLPTMLFLGVVAELAGLYFHELGEVAGVMSHESHHVQGRKNFGSIGLMDMLHGTFMKTLLGSVYLQNNLARGEQDHGHRQRISLKTDIVLRSVRSEGSPSTRIVIPLGLILGFVAQNLVLGRVSRSVVMMRVSPDHFFRALAPAAVLVLLSLFLLMSRAPAHQYSTSTNLSALNEHRGPSGRAAGASRRDAGNSTLGFSGIYFINMKKRYDRLDALSLQCFLSGVEVAQVPAVEPDMMSDAGMPPSKSPSSVKVGEKGAWRAHANIWSTMLRHNLPPVLILESDATWDINIRKIMLNLNKHFHIFLKNIRSTELHNPRWRDDTDESVNVRDAVDDPWQSDHWDILSLGQCHDSDENRNISLIFNDPAVPPGKEFDGKILGRQRVIRKAGGIICTTAYAISQTGAAKLLLKTSQNLDAPLDLIVKGMVLAGELVAYSVMPPIMAQWQYVDGIGMDERGANSDIQGVQEDVEKEEEKDGWGEVDKSGSVWTTKPYHEDVAFEDMALEVAWQRIFGRTAEGG